MYWVKDTKQLQKDRYYHFHHIFYLHLIVLLSPRLTVLLSPRLIVPWSPCLIVLWSPHLIVPWSPCLIVLWSPRLFVLWSPCLIVLWSPPFSYIKVCTCRCRKVVIRHQHTGFKKLELWTQSLHALNQSWSKNFKLTEELSSSWEVEGRKHSDFCTFFFV